MHKENGAPWLGPQDAPGRLERPPILLEGTGGRAGARDGAQPQRGVAPASQTAQKGRSSASQGHSISVSDRLILNVDGNPKWLNPRLFHAIQ